MARCLNHWADPAQSREAPLGPYLCGRSAGHKGVHAREGSDGSFAAWTRDGVLLMATQRAQPRPEPSSEPFEEPAP